MYTQKQLDNMPRLITIKDVAVGPFTTVVSFREVDFTLTTDVRRDGMEKVEALFKEANVETNDITKVGMLRGKHVSTEVVNLLRG